jgi:DinB superfamily
MSLYGGWDPPRPGWVCEECGFDYDGCALDAVSGSIRGLGRRFRAPLTRGMPDEDLGGLVRLRPEPATWSALEYACHVRDALALYDWRIKQVLAGDRPELPAMRRDEVVVERAYNSQDPVTVADELEAAAGRLAERLDAVPDDGWDRIGIRDGEELSVRWMARNALHEGNHHLLDIGRVLRHGRGRD